MTFQSAELFRYKIPLRKTLHLKSVALSDREGLILKLTNGDGLTGYGEIAPFPGWHPENLNEADRQLQEILPQFADFDISGTTGELLAKLKKRSSLFRLFPSVHWGLDTAVLQIHLLKKGWSFAHLLGDSFQKIILINALLTSGDSSVMNQAASLLSAGYRTFKIKVGRQPLTKEAENLRKLRSVLGPNIKLRIDANRNWTISQAIEFAKIVTSLNLEYIEEPTHQLIELDRFYQETGLPVALDESVNELKSGRLKISDAIKVLVIKPTGMGGITDFLDWVTYAGKNNLKIVVSSAFESGYTLTILAELAALLKPGERAMGLQTFDWLRDDLINPAFDVVNGQFEVAKISAASLRIAEAKLKRIKKFTF